MATYTVRAAKTDLSKLLERVEAGEEVIIVRGKKPVARLVPISLPNHVPKPILRRRAFGALEGKLGLPDSFFFDPLPEEELKAWETGKD